ncbi:MAG: dihydrodipicolinate synthase family protein [Bryobacterales bacterium]
MARKEQGDIQGLRHRHGTTPFQADGSLDEATLQLVRRQIERASISSCLAGQPASQPEPLRALRVVEITVEECAGKIPVLAGCGGYNAC